MDSIIENAWASRDLLEKTETQKKIREKKQEFGTGIGRKDLLDKFT